MSFFFGDGFDLYTQITDCGGYWDGAFGPVTLALSSSGRFAGSRGLAINGFNAAPYITKTSGQNDAVHHISVAFQQITTLTGAAAGAFFTLYDGATAQCSVMFRSDGALLLTSGLVTGTALATYTGAIAAQNTWYQFEIEVVINNTTGSIAVRKLGNTSNDFFLGSLNTRASANNYANKIGVGNNFNSPGGQIIDDLLWRSDAASVPWVGDIRCFTRIPVSDASVQFTRSGSVVPVTPYVASATAPISASAPQFTPFIASCDGTIGSIIVSANLAQTANVKCSLFASTSGAPTTVLGSATTITNPVIGNNTFTFVTPVAVTRGTTYWLGIASSAGVSNGWNIGGGTNSSFYSSCAITSNTSYAAFPAANPPVTATGPGVSIFTVNITPTTLSNAAFVADSATDYAGGYVYSSTVGQSDLYTVTPIGSTPSVIVGVTTRAYCEKSDAGTRIAAIQLQSGAANVQTTGVLNTSWNWIARNDFVDPSTSAPWTAAGVNNARIGVVVNT